MRMRCGTIAFCVLCVTVAGFAMSQGRYESKRVAKIRYGRARSCVAVYWAPDPNPEGERDEGVQGIQVDRDGNLYVGDYVNGQIKKFSPTGRFLAASWRVQNIQSFALDRQGNIIVVGEGLESKVAKFDGRGRLAWYRSFRQVAGSGLKSIEAKYGVDLSGSAGGFYPRITDGPGNAIVVEVRGEDTTKPLGPSRFLGFVLGQDGALRRVLPEFRWRDRQGWWDYDAVGETGKVPKAIQVTRYREDGTVARRILLNLAPAVRAVGGVSRVLSDGRGGFITVSGPRVLKLVPKGAVSYKEAIVTRYGPDGSPIGQVTIPGGPFMRAYSNVAAGPGGDIYAPHFHRTYMDIVRYSLAKQARASMGSQGQGR